MYVFFIVLSEYSSEMHFDSQFERKGRGYNATGEKNKTNQKMVTIWQPGQSFFSSTSSSDLRAPSPGRRARKPHHWKDTVRFGLRSFVSNHV